MNLPDSVETALREVAKRHRLSPYALLQKTNSAPIVAARREVFRILREQGRTLSWIGRWFGLDHATVHHHLKAKKTSTPRLPQGPPATGELPRFDRQAPSCTFCGFQGPGLIAEDYHFRCSDQNACNERYDRYLKFRHELARRIAVQA